MDVQIEQIWMAMVFSKEGSMAHCKAFTDYEEAVSWSPLAAGLTGIAKITRRWTVRVDDEYYLLDDRQGGTPINFQEISTYYSSC